VATVFAAGRAADAINLYPLKAAVAKTRRHLPFSGRTLRSSIRKEGVAVVWIGNLTEETAEEFSQLR
jgi:hypothetical protein